jgi:HSP20 family molecular chaperone IbpA
MRGRQGVSVETTDDAYLISIDTAGASPEGVQVSPAGRGLSISRSTDEQTVQEDSFDDGRGYRRSFSFSRGSSSRRIPLPPDADVTKMTRENAEDAVRLRIPRLSGQGSDWDQGSPWGPSGRSGGASGAPGYPNQ